MTTKIQRTALGWIVAHGGEMMIFTGYKRMHMNKTRVTDQPVIACSVNVLDGLKTNKFVEAVSSEPWKDHLYRITEKGRSAR